MPLYDYRCTKCGHSFEARQSFNDDPVAPCPACGKRSERLITAVAVHFKGSGFYKTDYKSGNGRSSNGNGKSADSKAEGTSDTPSKKTESKSESSSTSSSDKPKASENASSTSKTRETAAKSDK